MGFAPIENQHLCTAHTPKGYASSDWRFWRAAPLGQETKETKGGRTRMALKLS
jgi:hypothetical protein